MLAAAQLDAAATEDVSLPLLVGVESDVHIHFSMRGALSIAHEKPKNAKLSKRQLEALPTFTAITHALIPPFEHVFAGRNAGEVVGWKLLSGLRPGSANFDCLSYGSHKGRVTAITFHNSSNLLLSGSADCTMKVWDVSPGDIAQRCIQTIPAHDGTVTTIATHCNLVLTGSVDKTVKVWAFDQGRERLAFPWLSAIQLFVFDAWVTSMWASPVKVAETSQGELFVGDGSGNITVLRSVTAHDQDSDGIVASHLELMRHTKGHAAAAAQTVENGSKGIQKILPIPNLNLLITTSFEDKARIGDIIGFNELVAVPHPEHDCRFVDMVWLPAEEELALLDNKGTLFLWSTKGNKFLVSKNIGTNASAVISSSSFAKPGLWVAHREAIEFITIERRSAFVEHKGHTERVLGLYLNHKTAALEGSDGAVASDADFFLASASVDNTIRLWTSNMTCLKTYQEKQSEISAFLYVAPHSWCVTGHDNGSLKFWSVTKDRTFRFQAHENTLSAVCEGFHRCAKGQFYSWHHLFTISYDGCLAVWDMPVEGNKAKCEGRLRVSDSELLCAVYDNIKYMYIVGDNSGTVSMWSVDELKPFRSLVRGLSRLPAHSEAVTCIVLDGNYAITGGEDEQLLLWNTITGELTKEFFFESPTGLGEIQHFSVIPENGNLLACTRNGDLLVFSQESGAATHHAKLDKEVSHLCWNRATGEIIAGMVDGIVLKVHISMLKPVTEEET